MSIMKKSFILIYTLFLIGFTQFLLGQETQKEIDEQVWRPFIQAYNTFDAEAYNNLHTDDVIRSTPWGLRIGEEYKKRNTEQFNKSKADGKKIEIDLRFEHRNASGDVAYDVGYYRVIYGDGQTSFGRFHVVLKKIDGVWKIAQDWDTNKILDHEVSEEDFLKANPMAE